jgi:hypothetical protein
MFWPTACLVRQSPALKGNWSELAARSPKLGKADGAAPVAIHAPSRRRRTGDHGQLKEKLRLSTSSSLLVVHRQRRVAGRRTHRGTLDSVGAQARASNSDCLSRRFWHRVPFVVRHCLTLNGISSRFDPRLTSAPSIERPEVGPKQLRHARPVPSLATHFYHSHPKPDYDLVTSRFACRRTAKTKGCGRLEVPILRRTYSSAAWAASVVSFGPKRNRSRPRPRHAPRTQREGFGMKR